MSCLLDLLGIAVKKWKMDKEVNVGGARSRHQEVNIETPVGLRELLDLSEVCDFSGFREEKTNMRRIVNVEQEVRCMREMIVGILDKQEKLFEENQELKRKCGDIESVLTANREMKEQLEEIKRENNVLLEKCSSYKTVMKGLGEKACNKEQQLEGAVSE